MDKIEQFEDSSYPMKLSKNVSALRQNKIFEFFGPERARTADPLLAKQVLYQLSYRPDRWWAKEELHL